MRKMLGGGVQEMQRKYAVLHLHTPHFAYLCIPHNCPFRIRPSHLTCNKLAQTTSLLRRRYGPHVSQVPRLLLSAFPTSGSGITAKRPYCFELSPTHPSPEVRSIPSCQSKPAPQFQFLAYRSYPQKPGS